VLKKAETGEGLNFCFCASAAWVDTPPGYLTKDEFLTLVGLSGNALHRGDFKSLSRVPRPVQKNHPDIVQWAQKIANLLQEHRILFGDGPTIFYCVLIAADRGGTVAVWTAQAQPTSITQ
jgi:hypothetical protein